ncbi:MAG TPA: ABC transporter permease [Nitrospiraceae bacterium]|nr:ABC transporter permease [Nitrospiraceae bacterium]
MSHTLELTWHLIKRDFQLRYAGSTLGILWSLAIPISQLLILVFVFRRVIPLEIQHYPLFVFTALLPWNWFSASLSAAAFTFVSSRDLLRYPNFHPELIIVVNTTANMLIFLLGLPILLGIALAQQLSISWVFVAIFPLLLIIQAFLITGLGFLIATANVFYRDVAQITHIVLSLLFFLTPVFYQPPADSAYGFLFEINPMSVVIQNYRKVLLDGSAPDWPSLALAFATSLVIFLLGYWVHQRYESDIIDAI